MNTPTNSNPGQPAAQTRPPAPSRPAPPRPGVPAQAPKKSIAEIKKETFDKAEILVAQAEQSLIKLSSPDFARRLHVNAINAIRKFDGDDMLLALQTDEGQKSFRQAIFDAAEMGLQINNNEGCLVVYGGKIQFQAMWQGLVEVAYKSGVVKAFLKGCFREKDDFVWDMGRIARHVIDYRNPDRGAVIGYWVRAILESGESIDEFKTLDDIEKVRKSSKSPNGPAWRNWYDEMAYKTVFRALCKRLPKTEALNKILAFWDKDFVFGEAATVSAPATKAAPRKNAFMDAVKAEAVDAEAEPVTEQQPQAEAPEEEPANE